MLKKVRFEYYRCFRDSTISFKQLTIIIGKNNAGKSTVIEALRMIAIAGIKAKSTNFVEPHNKSLGLPVRTRGIRINTDKLKIDLSSIVYFYNDRNAKVTAIFSDNSKIVLQINTEEVFACFYDVHGNEIRKKSETNQCDFGHISILPQIGPILEKEKLLTDKTIASDRDTYLSSRHFRNEVRLYKDEYFNDFQDLAERTWPGLRIREIEYKLFQDDFISFYIEDAGFTAELGLMGNGIQMWLQIVWFICKSSNCSTIIFDEPDVYMHPDLQRKLIKFIRNKFQQVIIATHSTEIISEIEPQYIVSIDKERKTMQYANSKKGVQSIIDGIGSVHNISLVRIAITKKCLFIEGNNDIKILSKLHSIIYPDSDFSLQTLPCVTLGGWSRTDEAFGAAKLFYDETEDSVKCYCILDHDYYTKDDIEQQKSKAQECFLNLHIWNKKEIENYLLIPNVLFRISGLKSKEYENFCSALEDFIEEFKIGITDQISSKLHEWNKLWSLSKCNEEARKIVDSKWDTLNNKLSIVPGKDMLSKINGWMKEKYSQNCSINRILRNIKADEIDDEVKAVIDELISGL